MNGSAKFCGSKCKCYIKNIIEMLMKIKVVKKNYTFRETMKNFFIEIIWDLFLSKINRNIQQM